MRRFPPWLSAFWVAITVFAICQQPLLFSPQFYPIIVWFDFWLVLDHQRLSILQHNLSIDQKMDIGVHCALPECHRLGMLHLVLCFLVYFLERSIDSLFFLLDFLPLQCSDCTKSFCKVHGRPEAHFCSKLRPDRQVPICPRCNKVVPLSGIESPQAVLKSHLDRNCQSAEKRLKVYTNRCSVLGCRKKEAIKLECDACKRNHCLGHRFSRDHNCQPPVVMVKRASIFNRQQQGSVPVSGTSNIFTRSTRNAFDVLRANMAKFTSKQTRK